MVAAGSEGEEVLAEAEEGQGKFYACNLQINPIIAHCWRALRKPTLRISQPLEHIGVGQPPLYSASALT